MPDLQTTALEARSARVEEVMQRMFERKLDGIMFAGELAMREVITAAIERNSEGYPLAELEPITKTSLDAYTIRDQMNRILLEAGAQPTSLIMDQRAYSALNQLLDNQALQAAQRNTNPLNFLGGALGAMPVFVSSKQ